MYGLPLSQLSILFILTVKPKPNSMDNQLLSSTPSNKPFDFKDFLGFKMMITLKVIPILYAVVAVIITLASLGMMVSGGGHRGIMTALSV